MVTGTSLMALIQQSLAFYICRRLDSPKWQNIQWELSGTNVQVPSFTKSAAGMHGKLEHA